MKTQLDKIDLLEKAMLIKTREDKTEFTCFSDIAPEELKDLFLEHYEVKDIDYQIFSDACDTIVEAWNNNEDSPTLLTEYIEENYNDFASVYYVDRLSYLGIHNDEEIADIFKEYNCENISTACAIWYDNQVKEAIGIILEEYLKI